MENAWRTSKEKCEGEDETKSAYERDEKEIAARSSDQQQAQEAAAALPDDLSAIPVPTEQEMHPAWLKAQEALRSIGGKTGQQQQEDTSGDAAVHHQQQSYEAAAAAVYGWPPNVGHQFSPYYQQQQPQHTMYDEQYQRQPPPQQYHHPQQQHRQQYRPRMMTGVYSNSTSSRPVPLAQVSVSGLHQSASPRFTKPIRFPSAQQHHQPPDNEVSTESQKFLGEAAGTRQYPVSLRSYIERAYRACEGAEEREKLENYLRQRVVKQQFQVICDRTVPKKTKRTAKLHSNGRLISSQKYVPWNLTKSEELALPPEDWDPSAEFSRSQLTNVEHFWTRNTPIAPSPEVLPASDKIIGKSGSQQHNHCALLSYSKRLGASGSDKTEQSGRQIAHPKGDDLSGTNLAKRKQPIEFDQLTHTEQGLRQGRLAPHALRVLAEAGARAQRGAHRLPDFLRSRRWLISAAGISRALTLAATVANASTMCTRQSRRLKSLKRTRSGFYSNCSEFGFASILPLKNKPWHSPPFAMRLFLLVPLQ
uniref:Uncharacterized protein n=1 Tax=Globodera rostochiensis TaxID=31243 RepID=A0A914GTD9_GLORO